MTRLSFELTNLELAVKALRSDFWGQVHLPGDGDYDAARLPWNRSIDPRPAIVAEATGVPDVRTAVAVACDLDLPFAVQATGHGTVVPADGGVLLKTSALATVEVDPKRRTARVGAGARWGDVIAAAAPYGLAPLSGTSAAVGIVGYTLGGGAGLLSRALGFAADSVLRADVVTVEAESLSVGPTQHPDLFWALRGGGGSFAVVTALEFQLYPVSSVWSGASFHPIERAARTLADYRDWAADEPDESSTSVTVLRMPDSPHVPEPLRGRPALAIRATYHGTSDAAESALAPLLNAAGPPIMGGFRSTSFAEASAGPAPDPMASRQHMDMFHELPDEVIDILVASVADGSAPAVRAVDVRHWGGAMGRPGPNAGPVGHRGVPFSAVASAPVHEPGIEYPASAAIGDLATGLRPYATGGTFLNFLTDPTRTRTAFTDDNWRRLTQVKRTWDPDNFLRLNHNIPAAPDSANGDFR